MTEQTNPQDTTEDGATEELELEAPPAAPLEGEAPDDGEEEDATPASSPSIRERMAQLKDRETSAGFGVAGKFDGARADYTDQGNE